MIKVEKKNGYSIIQMNRPEKLNAINLSGYQKFTLALNDAAEDPEIRATIIIGAGPSFSSGNDLEDFSKGVGRDWEIAILDFLQSLARFPKVLIGAVQGHAVGVGATMLLHCDLVYLHETADISFPFIHLGLVPEAGATWSLPRLIGRKKASEYLLLGRIMSAPEAILTGFANQTFGDDQSPLEVAEKVAISLSKKPAQGLTATKKLMMRESDEVVEEIIRREALEFMKLLQSETSQALVKGFLQQSH
ncbi:MAG: enoyl-CoA hydratase-related protein [SAR324 cluster bacterium]|nr:enoyl-CoA hydratase-related protein [SAR324 cluster bacterium]